MKLLVLSAADVREVLGYPECAAAMRGAFTELSAGRAVQPLRSWTATPAVDGLTGIMPALLPGAARIAYGLKVISIRPGNAARGAETHLGLMVLTDFGTGEPLAVLNASALTEIRTAAVSVLATDVLACPGASDLAIVGTGAQARAHALAFSQSRPLRQIRIGGRSPARAAGLADELRPLVSVPVLAAPSVRHAVDGADIIVTVTGSPQPVLYRDWVAPGAHVNAVGASQPATRELDGELVAAAGLFADSRAAMLAESGDFLLAQADGLIGPERVRAELGEVLNGTAGGRAGESEITIFKSLGLAVEDVAAAQLAYENAASTGSGQWTDF